MQVKSNTRMNNCDFTGGHKLLLTTDAVVIHSENCLTPHVKGRSPRQSWVFLNDEALPNILYSMSGKSTTFSI